MAAKSAYLEGKILDHVLGRTTYTAPATLYAALFTSAPNDAGGGTEVSAGGYARVAITNNTTNFPNASGSSKSLAVAHVFPTASAVWGSVVAVGLYDASTGGNLLYWASITPRTVNSGDIQNLGIGSFTFTED